MLLADILGVFNGRDLSCILLSKRLQSQKLKEFVVLNEHINALFLFVNEIILKILPDIIHVVKLGFNLIICV